MQSDKTLLQDAARVAAGAVGALGDVRQQIESMFRDRVERLLARMDLPTREEVEAAREMAAAARDENERLAARVAEIEAKVQKPAASGRATPRRKAASASGTTARKTRKSGSAKPATPTE